MSYTMYSFGQQAELYVLDIYEAVELLNKCKQALRRVELVELPVHQYCVDSFIKFWSFGNIGFLRKVEFCLSWC